MTTQSSSRGVTAHSELVIIFFFLFLEEELTVLLVIAGFGGDDLRRRVAEQFRGPVHHVIVFNEGEATLRQSLLLFGHLTVRVHKLKLAIVLLESEGSLVAGYALVSEVLEDLLESRLRDTVLFDAKSFLVFFKSPEEPANGLVFFGDAQLEEFTALLKDLDLLEVVRQEVQNLQAAFLCFQELDQVSEADFALVVQISLKL